MAYAFRARLSSVVPFLHTAQEVEDQPNESGFRETVACECEQTLARVSRQLRACSDGPNARGKKKANVIPVVVIKVEAPVSEFVQHVGNRPHDLT